MAKALGIPVSLILVLALCLYLTVLKMLSFNHDEAVLDDYPNKDLIKANLTHHHHSDKRPLFIPPLHTAGRHILDSTASRLKLVSVNWYGASDKFYIPGGLDIQHRHDIAHTIRKHGFNSVRLPYADEMVRANPFIPSHLLAANGDLVGCRALDVFHAVVTSLTDVGIAVIVNNHITQARWCCDGNPCDSTWSNTHIGFFCPIKQTQAEWIENWKTIMRPHVNNPFVVGADLRNEVRSLQGRLLWRQWAAAAEELSEVLLELQPDWLMVVEGVQSANDISGARTRPIKLSVPHKLVYSAHVYGWSGWGSLNPYWKREYDSFAADMQRNWAWLLDADIAPVWVGEMGAPEVPNKGDLNYWKNLVRFLEEKDADFGYWAINPRKPDNNEKETYSLFDDDWETFKYDYRTYDMSRLARIGIKTLASHQGILTA